MSDYDRNAGAPGLHADAAIAIDAGLRAYMLRVYNYMAAGVGLTGVVAFLTYQFTGPELLQSPLMWVFILAPLGLVFFISARINTLSAEAARALFFVYAALVGVSLSIASPVTMRRLERVNQSAWTSRSVPWRRAMLSRMTSTHSLTFFGSQPA